MWNYEKRLQYPINITTPNAKIAQIIMSQYGGPDGEMGACVTSPRDTACRTDVYVACLRILERKN